MGDEVQDLRHPTLEKTHGELCPECVEALGGVGEEVALAKPDSATLSLFCHSGQSKIFLLL